MEERRKAWILKLPGKKGERFDLLVGEKNRNFSGSIPRKRFPEKNKHPKSKHLTVLLYFLANIFNQLSHKVKETPVFLPQLISTYFFTVVILITSLVFFNL